MRDHQPHADHKVTLLGGGPVEQPDLDRALALAPRLVAADGGARHAHIHGQPLSHIIGDLDSLTNKTSWQNSGTPLTHIDEQDTTDFEKCLYTENANFYIGLGFLGRRIDHTLACLRSLGVYSDKKIILMGEGDIVFLCPRRFEISLDSGGRVSFFPLAPVSGTCTSGLEWGFTDMAFDPLGQIGTSNRVTGGALRVEFDADAMLMILPDHALETAFAALGG